jgi:uncharacterized protein (TIGR00730 family)
MNVQKICVYCGSRAGSRASYKAAAVELGTHLAREKLTLVYGGATSGNMGAIADAALAGGGRVEGVIPTVLVDKELAHRGLSESFVVPTMHARKIKMFELADAFIAMPGGFGTLEEILEVITWSQIGIHAKPIGFLNIDGYYNGLLAFMQSVITEGFAPSIHAGLYVADASPTALVAKLRAFEPPPTGTTPEDRRGPLTKA